MVEKRWMRVSPILLTSTVYDGPGGRCSLPLCQACVPNDALPVSYGLW